MQGMTTAMAAGAMAIVFAAAVLRRVVASDDGRCTPPI